MSSDLFKYILNKLHDQTQTKTTNTIIRVYEHSLILYLFNLYKKTHTELNPNTNSKPKAQTQT